MGKDADYLLLRTRICNQNSQSWRNLSFLHLAIGHQPTRTRALGRSRWIMECHPAKDLCELLVDRRIKKHEGNNVINYPQSVDRLTCLKR
jgi:hypothetical protein